MSGKGLHKFFLSIVFPSILAIILFIVSMFVVILPSFEQNIMDKKKEMISELTNTAWSLLEEFDNEHKKLNYSLEDAKKLAASRIEKIRYGNENKDYFWIIDMHPTMIMHPYRSELKQTDLSDYEDPNGVKLFVQAAETVRLDGEGFIDYMWQWKDDSTRIVPKLSYVKGYEPWGWIVGTGIYLEDVQEEISTMKGRVLRISIFITLTIAVILSFVIRQSLNIERKRKTAEADLLLSRQKYKSLVEAATEGTLMIINKTIIFSNAKFNELAGIDAATVLKKTFNDIFRNDWNKVIKLLNDKKQTITLETQIIDSDKTDKEVILSVSKMRYGKDTGYIIIVKEITGQKQLEIDKDQLADELQASLLLMNQPIRPFVSEIIKCSIETPIKEAALLMTRKDRNIIFIQKDENIIGIINNNDLKKRVLAQGLDPNKPVMDIMTSPIISISSNALLYEAILVLKSNNISHLAIKNQEGTIIGEISQDTMTGLQQNTLSYLVREIEVAEDIEQLTAIHQKVPVLVNALVESGDKTQSITRIITSVTDAITCRILALAIEEFGKPPCEFAFMAMGSEGRMEQTLSTDQDNAIVFEDLNNQALETAKEYFGKLAKQVNNHLNTVGYKFCDGEIMAENPKWTQPLSQWKDYFTEWINTSDPQSILDASIFFDFRCVFGKESLITDLRQHVNEATESKSVFFYHLAQSITKYKAPLSLFGNIVDKNHSGDRVNVDVKKILLPVVGFIRLYALNNQLAETNTLDRVRQLHAKEVINQSMFNELVIAYNYLMQIRFRFQTMSILQNKQPDNIIDIKKLTHIEVATIKKIFGEITNLQTKLNFDFKGSM